MTREFKHHEIVKFNPTLNELGYSAKKGDKALVIGEDDIFLTVKWMSKNDQQNGAYFKDNFQHEAAV